MSTRSTTPSRRIAPIALAALVALVATTEAAAAPPSKHFGPSQQRSGVPIAKIIRNAEPMAIPEAPAQTPIAGMAKLPERGPRLSVRGTAAAHATAAGVSTRATVARRNQRRKLFKNGRWPGAYYATPNAQVGRLFFDKQPGPGEKWGRCSATAVNSENKSLVATAGHCVVDPFTRTWYEHIQFCPGYERGCKLGVWHARQVYTTNTWFGAGNFADDMAVVLVNPNERGYLVDAVGAQGITFNANVGVRRLALGYPGADARWPQYRYDGEDLVYCPGVDRYASGNIVIGCTMTGGSSGGPWLTGSDSNGFGFVNGINSHKPGPRSISGKVMASPYLGDAEASLFQYARAA
jgi:hypothetical protein